ncbi:MAG: glucose-6-phosphate isomerase [Candidatus Izemoplasmataceae bacterium]
MTYAEAAYKKALEDDGIDRIRKAHEALLNGSGKGSDYTGWIDLPDRMRPAIKAIEEASETIVQDNDYLLVIGIGGSYLGAKAAIEALSPYYNSESRVEVLFAGHHISGEYMADLMDFLKDKRFAINVISKSGTTTEPAIAFRAFKGLLEKQVGKEAAKKKIFVTTDASKGALRKLADDEGFTSFVIADDIGGRYSVLSPVGLLPIAAAGIDIASMIRGASEARLDSRKADESNPAYQYVLTRNALYEQGKKIEMFVHYEPKLHFLGEWWKQLFGESEGKENKGLFPASAGFTTDLHSLGQYIQEGERHLFETVLNIKNPRRSITIEEDEENADHLNYLAGRTLDSVNKGAMHATLLAHYDGGTPSIVINLEKMDSEAFGYLVFFYEMSCALSGYLLGVNPFDQPGVEAYKRNMFALLEKPGFEDESERIKKRISDKKTR